MRERKGLGMRLKISVKKGCHVVPTTVSGIYAYVR